MDSETDLTLRKHETSIAKLHIDLAKHTEIAKYSVATVNQILKDFDTYAAQIEDLQNRAASQEEHFKQREHYYRLQIEGLQKTVRGNHSIVTETIIGNTDPRIEKLEAKVYKPTLYEKICLKLRYLRKR